MKTKIDLNVVLFASIIIILIIGANIFGGDYKYIFSFWLSLTILGILFFPITSLIFKKSHDKGWIFSKIIGLGLSGFFMWLTSYIKVLKYSQASSYIIIVFCAIANLYIFIKNEKEVKLDKKILRNILITEILFLASLFLWIYVRGLNPSIDNYTEKYMDYGYMNSIMNTEYMPPEDIWYAGNSINYYYFGQYISGYLCNISGVDAIHGYNLMLALISALTFIMPFSIGFDLADSLIDKNKKNYNKIIIGLLATSIGITSCLGGTLHFPIYKIISSDRDSYYYADGTRYIGYNPETDDKVNVENPAYSSVAGDLHAHFIDLIFSLTIIAILLQYFISNKNNNFKEIIMNWHIIVASILLGIQKMTNYWDFVIFFVIISLIIIIKQILENKINLKSLRNITISIIQVIIIQELVSLPFLLDFKMISSNIYFTETHTYFFQLLVLWGLPVTCLISLFIMIFISFIKNKKDIYNYCNKHLKSLFVLILGICALGLIIIPEIIYVKDIYSKPYIRFNTVFKVTYEAFILFAICTNYAIIKLLLCHKKIIITFGIILAILNISTFGYGIEALIYANYGSSYIGIGEIYEQLKDRYYNDYLAIEWMNSNIPKGKVILEASAYESSYTFYSRVSIFTGNPTVMGWFAHQWLWRNENYEMPKSFNTILSDIEQIYTNSDIEIKKDLIKKYNISYIFVGELEKETYYRIDIENLKKLGKIIYPLEYDKYTKTYIIKVNDKK